MELFLDTNVVIGYSIFLDPWHELAKNVFNKNETLYWSTTVKNEYEKKVFSLMEIYKRFFIALNNKISEKEIIGEKDFIKLSENMAIEINNNSARIDQKRLGQIIWESGGWFNDISTSEIKKTNKDLYYSLINEMGDNYKYCINILNLHNREKGYDKLLIEIKRFKVGNNKIHFPDDQIILDAHDLAKNLCLNFVTSDSKLLEFREQILKSTNIHDMHSLNDYLINS